MSKSPAPSPAVSIEFLPGERPAVRSVDLARHFGLQHKHVLRDIKQLMSKLPESFHEPNFGLMSLPVEIGNGAVRQDPCYLLTRDAFTLLVMGWNSSRAIEWKLRYIEAFNALERAALENARQDALAAAARAPRAFSPAQRAIVDRALAYRAKGLTIREIAKLLDCHRDTVSRALQLAGQAGMLPAAGRA